MAPGPTVAPFWRMTVASVTDRQRRAVDRGPLAVELSLGPLALLLRLIARERHPQAPVFIPDDPLDGQRRVGAGSCEAQGACARGDLGEEEAPRRARSGGDAGAGDLHPQRLRAVEELSLDGGAGQLRGTGPGATTREQQQTDADGPDADPHDRPPAGGLGRSLPAPNPRPDARGTNNRLSGRSDARLRAGTPSETDAPSRGANTPPQTRAPPGLRRRAFPGMPGRARS